MGRRALKLRGGGNKVLKDVTGVIWSSMDEAWRPLCQAPLSTGE